MSKLDQINRIGRRGIAAQVAIICGIAFGAAAAFVWPGFDWGRMAWFFVIGLSGTRLAAAAAERAYRQFDELDEDESP